MKNDKEIASRNIGLRISEEERLMMTELQNIYFVNISKLFRETIRDLHRKYKEANIQNIPK